MNSHLLIVDIISWMRVLFTELFPMSWSVYPTFSFISFMTYIKFLHSFRIDFCVRGETGIDLYMFTCRCAVSYHRPMQRLGQVIFKYFLPSLAVNYKYPLTFFFLLLYVFHLYFVWSSLDSGNGTATFTFILSQSIAIVTDCLH